MRSGSSESFWGLGVFVAISIASIPLFGAACGNDDAPPSSNGAADGGTSPANDVQVAAPRYPRSDVDPCRGQPLPDTEHYVPPGMCARYVGKVSGVRQLTFAPNGDLFAVNDTTIHLLRDADGDGFFTREEISEWGKTGGVDRGAQSNNVAIDLDGGFVYSGSSKGAQRTAYTLGAAKGGAAEDVVVGQPSPGHTRRTVRVYDGFLYIDSGSSGNASNETSKTEYDTMRSLIKRFDLSKFVPGAPFDWSDGEVVTGGIRNPNGFSRNETTGKIYAVVNGLDHQRYKGRDVHDDNPGEQVVEIAAGKRYGYPFCFTAQRVFDNGDTGNLIAPGTQLVNESFTGNVHDDAWCGANSSKPTTFVQAHSAPLDIAFFDEQPGGPLPERWRGGAFIAFHGSWNRETKPTGYKVVWQPFNADGSSPMPTSDPTGTTFPYEVVFGGGNASAPKDGPWSWSSEGNGESPRPAGVAISPVDGALYIASDQSGLIYRVGTKK